MDIVILKINLISCDLNFTGGEYVFSIAQQILNDKIFEYAYEVGLSDNPTRIDQDSKDINFRTIIPYDNSYSKLSHSKTSLTMGDTKVKSRQ